MKVLLVTNLYPPHLADTDDFRCQDVANALRECGHTVCVLTSTCGLSFEQRDVLVERRLRLNGVFRAATVSRLGDLRALEEHNNTALREAIASFTPDVVHVWSLRGLSKSLLLTLCRANIPTAFDVADTWMADELPSDPWLSWWHRERVSALHKVQRTSLEISGQRAKWDALTPTFVKLGTSRLPDIFDYGANNGVPPNSIGAFQFRRLYFSSPALRASAARAGFRVAHGEVIRPGVDTRIFCGAVKHASVLAKKFLVVTQLTPHCGVTTAIEALKLVRAQNVKATLTICGHGSSEVRAGLRTLAMDQGMAVEFRSGGLQGELLAETYRAHDAFLYAVEREEAFISAPLEAMACGLPIIVNQVHSAADLFRPQVSCLTFPSGDAGPLADRMLELIEHRPFRRRFAQVGQAEVLSNHPFATAVDQIERYLEDTAAQWQLL